MLRTKVSPLAAERTEIPTVSTSLAAILMSRELMGNISRATREFIAGVDAIEANPGELDSATIEQCASALTEIAAEMELVAGRLRWLRPNVL